MRLITLPRHGSIRVVTVLAAIGLLHLTTPQGIAQTTGQRHEQAEQEYGSAVDQQSLTEQLHMLQAKVAKLETALKQNHQVEAGDQPAHAPGRGGHTQDGSGGPGMAKMGGQPGGSMQGMGGTGSAAGMGMGGMGMGGMGMDGMGMGGMKMMGSGMSMMGQMQNTGQMQMPSALPGFAGASHIYHVGATSFFLDHPQHIALTQDQQIKLNQIKEKALLGQATFDRWISQGEQELWVLTSSDVPNVVEIEAKIREIEKLRGDKRIAYIRSVGAAAQVLTNTQRQALVGMLSPDHAADTDN